MKDLNRDVLRATIASLVEAEKWVKDTITPASIDFLHLALVAKCDEDTQLLQEFLTVLTPKNQHSMIRYIKANSHLKIDGDGIIQGAVSNKKARIARKKLGVELVKAEVDVFTWVGQNPEADKPASGKSKREKFEQAVKSCSKGDDALSLAEMAEIIALLQAVEGAENVEHIDVNAPDEDQEAAVAEEAAEAVEAAAS